MIRGMSTWLLEFSKPAVALSGVLIFVVFLSWVLPSQAARAEKVRGDLGSPDRSVVYTPSDLYRMVEDYGPEGRADYIKERFTFDLIWPLVYVIFLSTTISWSFRSVFPPDHRVQRVNLVPLLGGILDYLENLSTSVVIWCFPARMPVVSWLATLFTLGKWVMIGVSFLLLTLGGILAVWRRLQGE